MVLLSVKVFRSMICNRDCVRCKVKRMYKRRRKCSIETFIVALLIIIITITTGNIIIITVNITVTNIIIVTIIIIIVAIIIIIIVSITNVIIIIITITTVLWVRQLEHFIEEIAEEMTLKYWSPALLTDRSGR